MAFGYRSIDRDQGFLLPVDMRDWLPADHLVWFILDVVEAMDTSALHAERRLGGVGRAGFDPDLLLGLLVYAYCHGIRSSRKIEAACHTDVAFRVLCAQDAPDHSVIARFRSANAQALAGLFAQVLVLCAQAGLARVGIVAVDGTKIAANASELKFADRAKLERLASELIGQAEQLDHQEDEQAGQDQDCGGGRGDRLDRDWVTRERRAARIRSALEELNQVEATLDASVRQPRRQKWQDKIEHLQRRVEDERAEQQRRIDIWTARGCTGKRPVTDIDQSARVKRAQACVQRAKAGLEAVEGQRLRDSKQPIKINTTDPQARIMRTRKGWICGYNAQQAVSADGIILAAYVTQHTNDVEQFEPALAAVAAAVEIVNQVPGREESIGTLLADAGYLSHQNLTCPGPNRLIALGKNRDVGTGKTTHPGKDSPEQQAMAKKLATDEGKALYRRRGPTVEPVNGHIKDRRGLRQFARRGLTAVNAEFQFAAAVTNLMKLYTTTWAPAH